MTFARIGEQLRFTPATQCLGNNRIGDLVVQIGNYAKKPCEQRLIFGSKADGEARHRDPKGECLCARRTVFTAKHAAEAADGAGRQPPPGGISKWDWIQA